MTNSKSRYVVFINNLDLCAFLVISIQLLSVSSKISSTPPKRSVETDAVHYGLP
jgi:hypothetical protein